MELEGLEIADLEMTCPRYPSQWEGRLSDGRAIFIRYRSKKLAIVIGTAQWILKLEHSSYEFDDEYSDGEITMSDVKKFTGLIGPKEIN